jgi:hypothetical protein
VWGGGCGLGGKLEPPSHPNTEAKPLHPMVLRARVCGRVGRRAIKSRKSPSRKIGAFSFGVCVYCPEFPAPSSPVDCDEPSKFHE